MIRDINSLRVLTLYDYYDNTYAPQYRTAGKLLIKDNRNNNLRSSILYHIIITTLYYMILLYL